MREIKFRSLKDDMSDYRWVYGSLVYHNGTPMIKENKNEMLFTTCIKGTDGQYTGLKDKNGKEIYEGDIVAIHSEFYNSMNEDSSFDRYYKGVIVLTATKGACLKNPTWHCNLSGSDGHDKFYKPISACRSTVIGNIHDNPELLK